MSTHISGNLLSTEVCFTILMSRDHVLGLWQALYSLAFQNFTLSLFNLSETAGLGPSLTWDQVLSAHDDDVFLSLDLNGMALSWRVN